MTTIRKSLHSLQPAAGDKENLVGPGRMIHADKDNLKSLRETNENEIVATPPDSKTLSIKRKKIAAKPSKSIQVGSSKPVITEEDLTSTAGPSENYWELLAEQRRCALEDALKENEALHQKNEALLNENEALCQENEAIRDQDKRLHDKVKQLREENRIFKELLSEQESLVEVLKEMLNDPAEESVNINDSLEG